MPESELRLIKRSEKLLPVDKINSIPDGLRGFYVLYNYSRNTDSYDVVYVGVSSSRSDDGHLRWKLKTHSKKKEGLWSHFSIYEVWGNIHGNELRELKGLFREMYKKDSSANKLIKQKGSERLEKIPKILN
jgi:hypothetical protein